MSGRSVQADDGDLGGMAKVASATIGRKATDLANSGAVHEPWAN